MKRFLNKNFTGLVSDHPKTVEKDGLWQFGKYNSKGKRVRDTWRYFDEAGEEF